jgi:mannose-1-phosphate guanylyltransferase
MSSSTLYAVVMAGGRGTRFWPLSRRALPKQCLSLDGGPTLIQRTVARLHPLVPIERVLVVTGPDMVDAVREQLPGLPAANLFVEPSPRNTAPVVAWMAYEVERRGGGVIAVLPSDHAIADEAAFRDALAVAAAVADREALVTLGVVPTRAETGYGWIEPADGDEVDRPVARFVEKPPHKVAEALLAGGRHLWNAGMFLWRHDVVLRAVDRHLPGSAAAVGALRGGATIDEVWTRFEATSVDYGVLEHATNLRVLPVDFGWSDVGSWTALGDVLSAEGWGSGVASAVVAEGASRNLVHAAGKLVALLNVEDLIIVDTADTLLVARRQDAQAVKNLLDTVEGKFPGRYS